MVTLTDAAIKAIKDLSGSQGPPNDKVRITAAGDYYAVEITSEPSYGDEVMNAQGVVVVIDSMSMLFLEDAEVDYLEESTGGGFTFRGPNLASEHARKPIESIKATSKKSYVQSMPCRIDRAHERRFATELSNLHPGDIVAFSYDKVQYEAVVQKVNATYATVKIGKIAGSPSRVIAAGERVHVAASILARGRTPG